MSHLDIFHDLGIVLDQGQTTCNVNVLQQDKLVLQNAEMHYTPFTLLSCSQKMTSSKHAGRKYTGGTQNAIFWLKSRGQELSNSIWHPYVAQYRRDIYSWKALGAYFSMARGTQLCLWVLAPGVPEQLVEVNQFVIHNIILIYTSFSRLH